MHATHTALTAHALDEGMPHLWPATLARIVDAVNAELVQSVPDPVARYEMSTRVVVAIARQFGGKDMYLPRGESLRAALLHAQVWRLSADCGWPDWRIAEWANICERAVRKIIAQQRDLRINRVQGQLELVPAA